MISSNRNLKTQNGRSPNQILRLWLSPDERSVKRVETLAEGPQTLDDVSLGAAIGARFVFVAHSQWSDRGADGRMKADPAPAVLSSLPLPRPQR